MHHEELHHPLVDCATVGRERYHSLVERHHRDSIKSRTWHMRFRDLAGRCGSTFLPRHNPPLIELVKFTHGHGSGSGVYSSLRAGRSVCSKDVARVILAAPPTPPTCTLGNLQPSQWVVRLASSQPGIIAILLSRASSEVREVPLPGSARWFPREQTTSASTH